MAGIAVCVAIGCLLPSITVARGPWFEGSAEGFSESHEELPETALAAWNGTVHIRAHTMQGGCNGHLRLRSAKGSGLVVRLDSRRRAALVVTTLHVIRCADSLCNLRVGLAGADGSGEELWTSRVRVEALDRGHDLAFLEVKLPPDAMVEVPRLASTSCLSAADPEVLAIGWPNLTVRREWGVDPPANAAERLKRYSRGTYLADVARYRAHTTSGRVLRRMTVIFHNADVLPGSSGGPLLTTDGLVVGINSLVVGDRSPSGYRYCARESLSEHAGCLHLAIPAEQIADDMERLLSLQVALVTCAGRRDEPAVRADLHLVDEDDG